MTIKQFFKSKIFKCIIVLLCIALVSGGLLAILNDLLYVSPEELIARGVKSVLGAGYSGEQIDLTAEAYKDYTGSNDGIVLQAIKIKDANSNYTGEFLIKAQGKHGFSEGTISVYVLFDSEGKIENVAVSEYASSQTMMSKIKAKNLSVYMQKDTEVTTKEVASGANYSSTANDNAVNEAKAFVQQYKSVLEG